MTAAVRSSKKMDIDVGTDDVADVSRPDEEGLKKMTKKKKKKRRPGSKVNSESIRLHISSV
jgi:hypothetical protein